MISDNDNKEEEFHAVPYEDGPDEQEERTLTPKDLRALMHMLLITVKGITVPQKTFDEYPEDAKINAEFDEKNQVWRIWPPNPKPKRGIVTPRKRIILPN